MENYDYKVAGHAFRLSFENGEFKEDDMTNYAPFRIMEEVGEPLFHLTITTDPLVDNDYKEIGLFDDDIASIGVFKSEAGDLRFQIGYPRSEDYCIMDTDSSFCSAQVQLPVDSKTHFFCLNNCLMLLYAFAAAKFDTVLIHASVIKNNNEGFVFLGRSGTGKSTHSRLWINNIEGSELLNDDNPVVRLVEDKAVVFGSPWSGKTPCYRNESVPLTGIVRLKQAPVNKIVKLGMLQAYAAFLPSCSQMKWEMGIMDAIHSTVEKIAGSVACYQLECLPDADAAVLCYSTFKKDV